MKDHIPDWAGGRKSFESQSGVERLATIIRDSEATGVFKKEERTHANMITVTQARELWDLLHVQGGKK